MSLIINWFRKRRLRKDESDVPTGFLPLGSVSSVNVVIDVQDTAFEGLKQDILSWGRENGLKMDIFYIDLHKLAKGELLITSIEKTITRNDISWYGAPPKEKACLLLEDGADLFISMVNSSDFLIDYLCKCSRARFKVGRKEYAGHGFDMVISSGASEQPGSEPQSDSREVFACMKSFLKKIK